LFYVFKQGIKEGIRAPKGYQQGTHAAIGISSLAC